MANTSGNTIVLNVLRVASPDVLGTTTPLSVAAPCRFSNAKGDLREVANFQEVSSTAARSAEAFLAAVATTRKTVTEA